MSVHISIGIALAASAILLAGCGDSDDESSGDGGTSTPSPTSSIAVPNISELHDAAEQLVEAIEMGDAARMVELASDDLQVDESDFEPLANCIGGDQNVDILTGEVTFVENAATVKVTWRITEGERTDEGERFWRYEQGTDDSWALSEIPECPILSPS